MSGKLSFYCHGLPGSAAEIHDFVAKGIELPQTIAPLDIEAFDQATLNMLNANIHLIGFSLGALTAIQIAAKRPRLVKKLSLIAPAASLELGDFLPNMAGELVFKMSHALQNLLPTETDLRTYPGLGHYSALHKAFPIALMQ